MSIPSLISASKLLFDQVRILLEQLTVKDYSAPLPLINNNSIGKHIRHVLELYLELFKGVETGLLCYDKRERNLALEQFPEIAISTLEKIIINLERIEDDKSLILQANFAEEDWLDLPSTLSRELAYNLEHTVHHLAIIQIVVSHYYPSILLPSHFGLAYATQKHQNHHVHPELYT